MPLGSLKSMRLVLAFRSFFSVLSSRDVAKRVELALAKNDENIPKIASQTPAPTLAPTPGPDAAAKATSKPTPAKSTVASRSDALTLLSTMQRESRILDLVSESLDQYTDAQIGAAARDVLRDLHKSIDRVFSLKPLASVPEGERVNIPESASPSQWRFVGNANQRSGVLTHAGWKATKLELPQWTGSTDEAMVIAAAEVETA